jgi:F-type H+-transporting ATPase subunit b
MMDFDATLLIQFFNFLILLVLLNFLLFKPVLRALDKREKTIGSLFTKAEDVQGESLKLEKLYDEQAKERKKPIFESRDVILADAHAASTGIIEKARKDLSAELTRVKGEIESDSRKVRDALMADVERLGAEAAEKILKRSIR